MRFRGFHVQNRTGPAGHLLSVWRGESSQELCLPREKISQPFFQNISILVFYHWVPI